MIRNKYIAKMIFEKDVARSVTDFMILDGWRVLITDPVSDRATVNAIKQGIGKMQLAANLRHNLLTMIEKLTRGKGFGEQGMADRLFLRYGGARFDEDGRRCQSDEILWIEFKRPGEKAKCHQEAWHQEERRRGASVMVVDDIDDFLRWYINESGYLRRTISTRTFLRR